MAKKKVETFTQKVNRMSVDELKQLFEEELEAFAKERREEKYVSSLKKQGNIDGFRRKMRIVINKMYTPGSDEFKAAIARLPSYTLRKKTDEERAESICDVYLKEEAISSVSYHTGRGISCRMFCQEHRMD